MDDRAHALLAYSSAAPDCGPSEITSKSTSREFSPASPTPGADPKSQPAPVELSGPCLLGMAFPFLERMEDSAPVRAARYRHPLASGGFSPLLEMEEPPYKSWPKDHCAGHHFSHSGHESGQSVVGRTPHPQRVAQAGPHGGPTNRRQIHGPQTSSFPDPELENVPAQSPGANGLGRFSHGAHPELPTSLRFPGLVAPAPKSAAL